MGAAQKLMGTAAQQAKRAEISLLKEIGYGLALGIACKFFAPVRSFPCTFCQPLRLRSVLI